MNVLTKTTFFITFFIAILSFTACGSKEEKLPEVNNLPHYSQVTAIENKDSTADVFKIENNALYNIGNIEKIIDMVYSVKNSAYIYSVSVGSGQNLDSNKLVIVKDKKRKELKDFYSAVDLKINSLGDKIVFRTFSKDAKESAEGLKIYDINNKKYINMNSKVLVSGNLYQWIDENKIIYYGSIEGQKNSTKIYLYNFSSNKEEVYLDNMNGYCMYFTPIDKDILFLASQEDKFKLYYYDSKDKKSRVVAENIEEIYRSAVDVKNGHIFLFAEGSGGSIELYQFSTESLQLERITYDFPKQIDTLSGMGLDEEGNVYFSGMQNEDNKDKKDIFMYNNKERSINLISSHEGKYSVYSSDKS
ncbi:hypothetical protein [Clostridium magnum]|uniref:Translocation protein TolB n=1 Tax=Clostridium magnum DSM 2767 TaxID=1121326 RepID=A0A161X3V6_9CLOT|nr:hypothetical protein [Clostridium magnum]KZL94198.1 translocation protein TolB [Clostridium magnum DSM 2767]SHH93034.1 hypothetical protein SAMN02745944_01802 [Clostridium magnum DSM 2767]